MNAILQNAHLQLERKGFRELFGKGWDIWAKESSCSPCTKKISFVAGTIFTLCYAGGAFLFGTLALQEALEQRHSGEKRAPIIGHFAEWTMLGTFAILIAARYPYSIAQKGLIEEINIIFDPHLKDQNLTVPERAEIYKERLHLLQRCAQKFFFPPCTFPTGAIDNGRTDLMSIDAQLKNSYEAIEKELQVSNLQMASIGLEEICKRKSCCAASLLKVALVAGTVLALCEMGIYSIGIIESGEQALIDYREGKIPSIAGHSLEWTAEITAILGTILYQVFGEIASVGKAKKIAIAFNRFINNLEKNAVQNWKEQVARLQEVRDEMIDAQSEEFLFSLPHSLRFEKEEEGNPGIEMEVLEEGA